MSVYSPKQPKNLISKIVEYQLCRPGGLFDYIYVSPIGKISVKKVSSWFQVKCDEGFLLQKTFVFNNLEDAQNFARKKLCFTKANGIYKYLGLMFKNDDYEYPMVFVLTKPSHHSIHTIFCFFPIRCLFYDSEGELIENVILQPGVFRHTPPKPFSKLIEIPITNERRFEIVNGIPTKE